MNAPHPRPDSTAIDIAVARLIASRVALQAHVRQVNSPSKGAGLWWLGALGATALALWPNLRQRLRGPLMTLKWGLGRWSIARLGSQVTRAAWVAAAAVLLRHFTPPPGPRDRGMP